MVQLNDANEEVLLDAIASQSSKLDSMEGDELLMKLGIADMEFETEGQSEIMKEARALKELDNKPKWEIDKTAKKAAMQDRTKS